MKAKSLLLFVVLVSFFGSFCCADTRSDGCTTITVGRLASADGSVITSHTCDSHGGHTWLVTVPAKEHKPGSLCPIYKNTESWDSLDTPKKELAGHIPQVAKTYGYLYGFYGIINEHQLAIGESTFDGRKELVSKKGLLNCYELSRLIAERCRTAREAITLIDELTQKYGYNDLGECLTLADKKEVWHLEIVGPGKDQLGAVWAAIRIPDDHIGVCSNSSRIGRLEKIPYEWRASTNVRQVAIKNGWWNPNHGEPFRFCYAYNPEGRVEFACTRREWRVFSLLAPGLKLHANANDFPFTVKPEKKVSVQTIMELFRDTFEGTEYDMTKFMVQPNEKNQKMEKSPYANPFLYYDEMYIHRINGGWNKLGERPLARAYCVYAHVTQSRHWLPDPIGGIAWVGYGNPATTTYAPIYCCAQKLPKCYTINSRDRYSRESAWWAFVRVSKIAARIWGHMRKDVAAVRDQLQGNGFKQQIDLEKQAASLYKQDAQKAIELLSKYTNDFCQKITAEYWKLGDSLWVKYQDKM